MRDPKDDFIRILFTQEQIEKKCVELAKWVDETYENSNNLLLVGLLKGSVPFLAQLIKSIKVVHEIDFLTVSSYEGTTSSNGAPKIVMDLAHDINGKDVLIIEDIVDTGRTLNKILKILKTRDPKSIKILTLLDKEEGRVKKINVDKSGFKIPKVFVVGFGLDVNEKLRNIPYIGEFDIKKLKDY